MFDDTDEDDLEAAAARAAVDEEVDMALAAWDALVHLSPGDRILARHAVEAVVRAVVDSRGPDDATPGMMTVPALLEDPVARARLAEASPGAREPLGDLERALVNLGGEARAAAAERVRAAVRDADRRLQNGRGLGFS